MRNIKEELIKDGATEAQAEAIAKKVMGTLTIYATTRIWYANGRYDETPHLMITATYAPDHRMVTTIKEEEVYTPEQIKQNRAALSKMNWDAF